MARSKLLKEGDALPDVTLKGAGGAPVRLRDLVGLLPGRVTFVVDRQGTIRHAFESQLRVREHVRGALELVKTLAPG